MLDAQQPFRTMTIADLTGTATPEERVFLRSDENLELWRDELVSYLAELDLEIKRRKAAYFRLKNQAHSIAEANDFRAESLEFESKATERRIQAKRRISEVNRLIHERKKRREAERKAKNLAAQGPPGASKRLQEHAGT